MAINIKPLKLLDNRSPKLDKRSLKQNGETPQWNQYWHFKNTLDCGIFVHKSSDAMLILEIPTKYEWKDP